MKFSVGDKILLKKESIQGKIVRINSPYKVVVLSRDGFEMNVSVKDLVKIEKGTDKPASYGDNDCFKDLDLKVIRSKKTQRRQSVLKVDLHIEFLISDYSHMHNSEIIQIQLNECYEKIEKALNSK